MAISGDSNIAALRMGLVFLAFSCGQPADSFAAAVRHRFFYRSSADGRENGGIRIRADASRQELTGFHAGSLARCIFALKKSRTKALATA